MPSVLVLWCQRCLAWRLSTGCLSVRPRGLVVEVAAGGGDLAAGSAADAVEGLDVLDHGAGGPVGRGGAGEGVAGAQVDGQGAPDGAGAGDDLAGVGGGDPAVAGELARGVALAGGDLEGHDDPRQRRRLTRCGHGRACPGTQEGIGGEVGAELVEATRVTGAAASTRVRVEAVQDRGDRRGVGGDGQAAHPVVREAAEDPAPGPGVGVPLLAAAGIDGRDRPPQPRGERPLRNALPVAGGGEDGLGDGGHLRVRELGGLGRDLQRTVQRGRPGAQRGQHDPVPARRGREGEPAGDLPGADPGREGDLLGDDPLGRDPRGHPGAAPAGRASTCWASIVCSAPYAASRSASRRALATSSASICASTRSPARANPSNATAAAARPPAATRAASPVRPLPHATAAPGTQVGAASARQRSSTGSQRPDSRPRSPVHATRTAVQRPTPGTTEDSTGDGVNGTVSLLSAILRCI